MSYPTLRAFVDALDSAGELKRISAEVNRDLEISAIADRVCKSPAPSTSEAAAGFDPHHHTLGGHALLFENVAGSKIPVLINGFGSYRRMEMALGGTFSEIADKVESIAKPEPPIGLMEKVRKGLELAKVAAAGPKIVKRGRCQQIVMTGDDVNLFDLPIIKCWPHDGDPVAMDFPVNPEQSGTAQGQGRYITLAGIYTIHPDDAGREDARPSRNIGMYRAQLIDEKRTAMHWHVHHDGASHWRAWKKIGKPMPLAIVFGGESVLPYAATAPLPPGISEILFGGFLNGKGIELVPCKTIDMHVPANAEIVIEGTVSTEAAGPGLGLDDFTNALRRSSEDPTDIIQKLIGPGAVFEGPFGDHTGFYSLPDRYPILNVSAITHAENPIYPTTIVGPPPQEDYYLGKATERIFLPLLKTIIPDIIDYDLPMFGCFHNVAFVQIDKQYPLHARRVMHAIWGAGQMAWTKAIVVVDKDVNVHDHEAVLFHIAANCDPGRDLEIVNGPLDILDHAAPRFGAGHKIGFDATAKWPGEEVNGQPVRAWPPYLGMDEATRELVDRRWGEYGLG